jgi:nitrogen regulatory protein P-II 1
MSLRIPGIPECSLVGLGLPARLDTTRGNYVAAARRTTAIVMLHLKKPAQTCTMSDIQGFGGLANKTFTISWERFVKIVVAVIKPFKLDEVKDALKVIGVQGLTMGEVQGFGRQGGHTETYRGAEYQIDLVPKIRIEVLANDEDVPRIVDMILTSARSGRIGDGKVWVLPIEDLVRIRTGERGSDAI